MGRDHAHALAAGGDERRQYGFVAADFIISKTHAADLATIADACFRQLIADAAA
jgi:hypothetical protein